MDRLSHVFIFLAGLFLLSACGGGGGGGGPSGSSPAVGITSYTASKSPAAITTSNAAEIVNTIMFGDSSSKSVSPTQEASSLDNLSASHNSIKRATKNILESVSNGPDKKSTGTLNAQAINVDEVQYCSSGNITLKGTLSDSGLGTLSLTYNNCVLYGETFNGPATLKIDGYSTTYGIIDSTISFADITVTSSTLDMTINGQTRQQLNYSTHTETFTSNVVTVDSLSGIQTKTENFVSVYNYNSLYSPYTVSITYNGRIYHSKFGYIDIATSSPFVYSSLYQNYPNSGGPILFTGADNVTISVTPQSSTELTIKLDMNGDSDFEITQDILWTDLSSTVGSDIGDTDGDGMPNGWELANGLDPNDASDANTDPDNDGATNLQEYTSGSNPNSATSLPPSADLSISITTASETIIGPQYEYKIVITNNGRNTAKNIRVTDTAPTGVDFISATSSNGSCSVSTTVTCDINTLYTYSTLTIWITARTTEIGMVSNTASVSADEDDFNLDNNTATVVVEILPADTNAGDLVVDNTIPAWTTYQGNASHNGYVPVMLDHNVFQLRWSTSILQNKNLHPVVAADGKVFATTDTYYQNQTVIALNAVNGATLWSREYGAISSINPPAYYDGKVYFQTGGHQDSYLRALNANTGELIYRSSYGNQWSRNYAPTPFSGGIYISGGYYGGAYSFDATNGDQNWFMDLNQYDKWTPAVDANYVYAYTGEYHPSLTVINRFSGTEAFTIEDPLFDWNGWSMDLAPVIGNQNNILVTNDGRLISFDLLNKVIGWQLSGNYSGQVSVAHGKIFVINSGALNVLDELTGNLVWSWEPPSSGSIKGTMIVTDNLVFVQDGTATYAIDLSTHLSVWSYSATGHLTLSNDGSLYIAGKNGLLDSIKVIADSD